MASTQNEMAGALSTASVTYDEQEIATAFLAIGPRFDELPWRDEGANDNA
jgi:hypothetical protein